MWMKIDAACQYAGGLNRKLLYEAHKQGKLKASHVGAGRNLIFNSSWISDWLEEAAAPDEPPKREQ